MIKRVLNIVGLDPNDTKVKMHDIPATVILDNNPDGKPCEQDWNYRSAVGCLEYIQSVIRLNITTSTQTCTRFCNAPNKEHKEVVKPIYRYLLKNKYQGLVLSLSLLVVLMYLIRLIFYQI